MGVGDDVMRAEVDARLARERASELESHVAALERLILLRSELCAFGRGDEQGTRRSCDVGLQDCACQARLDELER